MEEYQNENWHWPFIVLSSGAFVMLVTFFLMAVNPNSATSVSAYQFGLVDQFGRPTKTFGQFFSSNPQEQQPAQTGSQPAENIPLPENLPEGINSYSLKPIGSTSGSATVITAQDGNSLSIAVEATLSDPASGKNYYAWLVSKNSSYSKLGKLNKTNSSYLLSSTQNSKLTEFKQVIISQESNDDNNIETQILQSNI